MLADQDTRDSQHEGMKQEMVQLYAAFSAEASYIEPEILRFPTGTIEKFLAAEPRLKVYEFYLKDIERRAPHTLSEAEEKLLADVGPLAGTPVERLRHPRQRRFAVSDGHAERRQVGQARSGGVQRSRARCRTAPIARR